MILLDNLEEILTNFNNFLIVLYRAALSNFGDHCQKLEIAIVNLQAS